MSERRAFAPAHTVAGLLGRHLWATALSVVAALALVLLIPVPGFPAPSSSASPQEPAALDSSFTHGTVPVEGGTIHYVRGGDGPPLVLLHGWAETWWEWRKVMLALAEDRTVIAVDLPGLGDSSHPSGGYDKKTTAARVREAVHKLGFDKVELLSHDIGAQVAYRYARDFPGEVTRLAVTETMLAGYGVEESYSKTWHYRFLASPAPFPEKIVDNADVKPFFNYFYDGIAYHPEAIGREEYFRKNADPADRSSGYDYYRAIPQDAEDNRSNISAERLPMPVMAIGGEYLFGERVGQEFARVADDVRTVVAPDAGHYVPEENPKFVVDCARLFFKITGHKPSTTSSQLEHCAP
ncbi:alpha/beta fold hydrolase [Streptomyces sp. NPDC003697]